MGVFSSFVDRRGIHFDKQQSRDKVSYLKKIIEQQNLNSKTDNPTKPYSFQDFLGMREKVV